MTRRIDCPPAPGPLEEYAARFDDLFTHAAQRRGFRDYLAGLLLPQARNKILTALAGAEPIVEAQEAPARAGLVGPDLSLSVPCASLLRGGGSPSRPSGH